MLHIRRRSEPTARWAARGWPPLLRWTDRPEVPWLFWALHEGAGAAQAEDFDAVDDLLTEAGLMLERVWTDPPARRPPERRAVHQHRVVGRGPTGERSERPNSNAVKLRSGPVEDIYLRRGVVF